MRTERVLTNYDHVSDAFLATLGGKTLSWMTGNGSYTDPKPSMADYETVVTDYRTKYETAVETGGKFDIAAKKLARLVLLESMRRLATYVNLTADGNANVLISSGFILASQPQSRVAPDVPLWVRLQDGPQRGQLKLSVAKVRWAWEYEYQVGTSAGEDDPIVWLPTLHRTTNSRGTVIPNLTSGQLYWVRVRARNGYGPGDWSDPVSRIVK